MKAKNFFGNGFGSVGKCRPAELAQRRIDRAIRDAKEELRDRPGCVAAFLDLLRCLAMQTDFLRARDRLNGWESAVFFIERLKNLAARRHFWKQWPVDSWRPGSERMRPAFHSLARHLFGLYELPAFMDSAWDLPLGQEGFRQQAWYIRLGRGESLRSLNPATQLTQRMEHYARQAPDHFTILQAMRYGEAMGCGAGELLAREIALSLLGETSAEASFWRTVVMFFATHREMPLKFVRPLIEFIHTNKFGGEEVLTVNGVERRAACWPEFSMHGRTVKSMLRLVTAWRVDLSERNFGSSWKACGVDAFRFLERGPKGEELDWLIVELLNSGALYSEGRHLQHCVFTYVDDCRRGACAIWSLRLRVEGTEKRVATIEVNRARRAIVQFRAVRNRRPGRSPREVVRAWAEKEGLTLDL